MIIIRPEGREHSEGVYRVEEQAFRRPAEAGLVERIRERGAGTLSLVALEDGEVVGHVLFSPVRIVDGQNSLDAIGLGPVAVLPARQRQGIGSRLIRTGLEEIRQAGHALVVVLGDPAYYTRFGFEPAKRYGVRFADANIPEKYFMLIELRRGILEGHGGVAYYEPEFEGV